jgi:hypothetical protein
MHRTNKTNSPKNNNVKTVLLVSLFWIVVAATVLAYIQNGNAQYNKGVFDGMSKTKVILQSK